MPEGSRERRRDDHEVALLPRTSPRDLPVPWQTFFDQASKGVSR